MSPSEGADGVGADGVGADGVGADGVGEARNAVRPTSLMPHIRVFNAVRARLFRAFWKRRFGAWGPGSLIIAPVAIEGEARIHLGADVLVAAGSCLAANPLTGYADCRVTIGDGCRIGRSAAGTRARALQTAVCNA